MDDIENQILSLDENLNKWFKEKWVRFGPDGKIRGDCAREKSSEGKPKCRPLKSAQAMGKKARATAARRKRREDPNPDRKGKAKNVKTEETVLKTHNCPICGGELVSEALMNEKKDACYYKVKSRYKVWPSAYASGALVKCRKKGAKNWGNKSEGFEEVDEACWKGYHKDGMKTMFGKKYPNCVKNTNEQEELDEKWSDEYKKSIDCDKPKGFSQKAHCQGRKKTEEELMKESKLKNIIREIVNEIMNGGEFIPVKETRADFVNHVTDKPYVVVVIDSDTGKKREVGFSDEDSALNFKSAAEEDGSYYGMHTKKVEEATTEEGKRFVVKNEKGETEAEFFTREEAEEFRDQQYNWDIADTKTGQKLEEAYAQMYRETNWSMVPEGAEHTCEGDEFYEIYGDINADAPENLQEAEYRGRKVKLGKPMRGDVKKFKVFVKNPKTGNVKKVNFGDPNMRIKKSNPKRRKSFRARHKCSTAKDRTSARYWSCRKW
jgi:hypothetical protein